MSNEIVIPPAVQVVIETNAVQGPPGPPGPPGVPGANAAIDLPFSWGDVSPAVIATAIGTVVSVSVIITTPFNGVGAQISVGTDADHELFMPVTGNFPDVEARFEANPGEFVSGNVKLFFTPGSGASAGAGIVYLEISD